MMNFSIRRIAAVGVVLLYVCTAESKPLKVFILAGQSNM